MQRKRGELGPIGEALADLSGPLQARHHFTRFDQVDQLVGASEANPERGFMAWMMMLCSLPRTNPGNRIRCRDDRGRVARLLRRHGDSDAGRTGRPGHTPGRQALLLGAARQYEPATDLAGCTSTQLKSGSGSSTRTSRRSVCPSTT